ncbi:hypothetical protein O6R05_01540 [Peptoniphilus equinus]|uniref:Uncharacterized protein n=1 Tax=Peptoniphilus equinus TaxID=3016343 RepID=A0ABY7QU00_9FIRM|nr:hypothetical protein [Peptoniphilus equinus]WBW50253.1 hypothetical protein O6R05_01540 [Peptoniphilus equinus]
MKKRQSNIYIIGAVILLMATAFIVISRLHRPIPVSAADVITLQSAVKSQVTEGKGVAESVGKVEVTASPLPIQSFAVTEGETVRRGQVLFVLDDSGIRQEIERVNRAGTVDSTPVFNAYDAWKSARETYETELAKAKKKNKNLLSSEERQAMQKDVDQLTAQIAAKDVEIPNLEAEKQALEEEVKALAANIEGTKTALKKNQTNLNVKQQDASEDDNGTQDTSSLEYTDEERHIRTLENQLAGYEHQNEVLARRKIELEETLKRLAEEQETDAKEVDRLAERLESGEATDTSALDSYRDAVAEAQTHYLKLKARTQQAQKEADEAAVERLAELYRSLETTVVKSPVDGRVSDLRAGVGDVVKGRVLTLITKGHTVIHETEVFNGKVEVGDIVTLNDTVSGKVEAVGGSDNSEELYLSTDTPIEGDVTLKITRGVVQGVLIPKSAIGTSGKLKDYVLLCESGEDGKTQKAVMHPVKTLPYDDHRVFSADMTLKGADIFKNPQQVDDGTAFYIQDPQ